MIPYAYVRDLPEIKVTNYLHMILMAGALREAGAQDLLYHDHSGQVSELTRSNLFLFKKDTLITPARNILHGITRKVVMELAAPYFPVEVREVTLNEVQEADEVFTTGSNKRVTQIRHLGDREIGTGFYPHSDFIRERFDDYIRNWGK